MNYINTSTLAIRETNQKLKEPWKPLLIDGVEHPILSIDSKYWKPVENDYPIEMSQAEKDIEDQKESNDILQAETKSRDLDNFSIREKAICLVLADLHNLQKSEIKTLIDDKIKYLQGL
jgi:hypothetical protein